MTCKRDKALSLALSCSSAHLQRGLIKEVCLSSFLLRYFADFPLDYGKAVVPWIVWLFRRLWNMYRNLFLPLLHRWQERGGCGWKLCSVRARHLRPAGEFLFLGADPIQDSRGERNRWYVLEWPDRDLLLSVVYVGAISAGSERRTWRYVHCSLLEDEAVPSCYGPVGVCALKLLYVIILALAEGFEDMFT